MIIARFTKVYTKGPLKGTRLNESMLFLSAKAATDWEESIDNCKTIDWAVENFYIDWEKK